MGVAPRVAISSLLCGSDRKSTRLNSSHGYISYAVFCLKKKTQMPHSWDPYCPAIPLARGTVALSVLGVTLVGLTTHPLLVLRSLSVGDAASVPRGLDV